MGTRCGGGLPRQMRVGAATGVGRDSCPGAPLGVASRAIMISARRAQKEEIARRRAGPRGERHGGPCEDSRGERRGGNGDV